MGNFQYAQYKEYGRDEDPLYWYNGEETLLAEILNDIQYDILDGMPVTVHGYKATKCEDELFPASTFAVLRRANYKFMSLQEATRIMDGELCTDCAKTDVHGQMNYEDYDKKKPPSYVSNRTRNIAATLTLPYTNCFLYELAKLSCGIRYESVPDIATAAYAFEKMNTKIESIIMGNIPGPPHWNGPEGGCLGLPTDIAKLILKWV